MAKQRKTQKADPILEAAVEYFAGRSHDAWRKALLTTNPEQKGKPRMRERGGVMVDINKPWSQLDERAKADNRMAARDAYDAVRKFPANREAAADFVHRRWMERNRHDKSQPKALFKPYAKLPEVEKDKDRAHVDRMNEAIAAVRKPARKVAKAKKVPRKAPATRTVEIDAETWARLEAAAKTLSAALGRKVSADVLANAGVEAIIGVAKAVGAKRRR
jgi:hypothetical protein